MLIQPSFEEGFGLTVLEAMSVGVPVVAARRGSLPDVLGGAGLLVDPEDPNDIACAIRRLLADDAHAAQCAAAGIARAATFRWETTARLVYQTYAQAMKHRSQAGLRG
jgi:alpha-1,3-rhamnosyl/mannosyltransferase